MSKAFGSRYSIENSEEAKEYFEFVKDLLDSDVVNEMKNFVITIVRLAISIASMYPTITISFAENWD